MGEKCERFTGTTVKDTWTKPRGVWKQGREVGKAGVARDRWGERQKAVLEQQ